MRKILSIGDKIKLIRKDFDLSQKEFAGKIGIQAPYLSELENGKKDITAKVLISLKENFKISSDWIMYSDTEHVFSKYLKSLRDNKESHQPHSQISQNDLVNLSKHFSHISIDEINEYLKYSHQRIKLLEHSFESDKSDLIKASNKIYNMAKHIGLLNIDYYKGRFEKTSVKENYNEMMEILTEFPTVFEEFENPKLKTVISLLSYKDSVEHHQLRLNRQIEYFELGFSEYFSDYCL
ncbi:MAG: helix-turn-helix domain-containing protein [Flavobacteriales bacterium]